MYKYNYIVSGGTFDHLHVGHKAFLRAQLELSNHVLIGVTSDSYIQTYKNGQNIEPFTLRIENLTEFLTTEHVLDRVTIESIDDQYIPSLWDTYPIQAIAVTQDTKSGSDRINKDREEKGLLPLEIVVLPHTLGSDKQIITSSRIRKGEIDREGTVYIPPHWMHKTFVLPENLRYQLQQPFGKLFKNIEEWLAQNTEPSSKIVTIGDEVTETLLQHKFGQKVAVVDLFVQREKKYHTLSEHSWLGNEQVISIKNPKGCITPELFSAAKVSLFSKGISIISIDGEEDLAVLSFVLLAPLDFQIMYGQPHEGIVVITVTDAVKKRAKDLLGKFTILASK